MNIAANGKSYELDDGTSLATFLESIGQNIGMVVVERNKQALPASEARETVLQDGDQLEVVRIVAGG